MDFFPAELAEYAENHSDKESELLARINRETHLHVLKPRMLSGHMQGRLLSMFSKMIAPKRTLEIGTYTGYSALCIAEGIPEDGLIYTVDKNEELITRVKSYFSESRFGKHIKFYSGDALALIPTFKEAWDLVFIDADKVNYGNYYDLIFDQLVTGGYVIADNVLWSGKVIDQSVIDEDTVAIREFNQKIKDDPRVENVLAPFRDGLMIIRKK